MDIIAGHNYAPLCFPSMPKELPKFNKTITTKPQSSVEKKSFGLFASSTETLSLTQFELKRRVSSETVQSSIQIY